MVQPGSSVGSCSELRGRLGSPVSDRPSSRPHSKETLSVLGVIDTLASTASRRGGSREERVDRSQRHRVSRSNHRNRALSALDRLVRERETPGSLINTGISGVCIWRYRWDLNPRCSFKHTTFRELHLRPLGHGTGDECTRVRGSAPISRGVSSGRYGLYAPAHREQSSATGTAGTLERNHRHPDAPDRADARC
jgi:hypothetical protein